MTSKEAQPPSANRDADVDKTVTKNASSTPRKIPGNLPYLPASGTLKKVLERILESSRPEKFNSDFLENILKLTGGGARATVPILKKMAFLTSDGTPTDLYAKFRTDSGRALAAVNGLRNAFPEMYKRSEYAHAVDDNKIKDIIVEITGLKPNDPVAVAIKSTFNVIKTYVPSNFDPSSAQDEQPTLAQDRPEEHYSERDKRSMGSPIGLSYNINIVLPETSDIKVLNAIFRSVRENLMT